MRRALLRCGLLLGRARSAQSAVGDLIAAGTPSLAAAAGSPGGGGSGRCSAQAPLPWALQLQAPLHMPALIGQAAVGDSGEAANSSGGSNGSSSTEAAGRKKRGRPFSPVPEVNAAQLLRSLGLEGAAEPAALLSSLRKLPGIRQQGMLDNAAAVAAHLLSLAVGLTQQQAGQLLQGCPELFSWPLEQRAAVLFGELMGAGLAAAAAAQCFIIQPNTAAVPSFAAGLAELAGILAHSQDRRLGGPPPKVPAAQRTVAALLQQTPSAVQLVSQRAGYLQRRAAELQQEGFTPAEVAALAWDRPELLLRDSAGEVADAAAVLQQELGLTAAEVISLVARRKPSWLTYSSDTLRERAAALAEGFGQASAAAMLKESHSALGVEPGVWRRNLRYMAACGVADPAALLRRSPLLLHCGHAASTFLQRRLLLQRCFQLTAAQLYEGHSRYLVWLEPPELAQRLQFVEQRGQAHRLVAKAVRGRKRRTASGEERQAALSLVAVTGPLPGFLAAASTSEEEWEAWSAANPATACPFYRWAQQTEEEEQQRLLAALPPKLRQAERRPHSSAPRHRSSDNAAAA